MAFRLPNEEFELDPVVVGALDKLLILHADHEQNCSTSTVRMVGSAHTGLLPLFLLVFLHFGDLFTEELTGQ